MQILYIFKYSANFINYQQKQELLKFHIILSMIKTKTKLTLYRLKLLGQEQNKKKKTQKQNTFFIQKRVITIHFPLPEGARKDTHSAD